ncbi:SDR family NAD(P)-dependent oxidoreductase [Piscinibacter sakaiensis]|uniref:SDR family NAD(P)-dependent oxidoreductase n=1 Tax=Piscinibacter sakaiensis TaxID=1547922 RepID=UPI003AAFC7FC
MAVITGGASGIGNACAQLLAAAGARVVVADRNEAAARAVAEAVGGIALTLDVGDEHSVDTVVAAVLSQCGVPQVLVNSAGVLQRTLPPEQLSLREWDFVARIDLRGTYLCCARFGAAMAERGSGAIVNIASVAGMGSGPLHSYGPAKAGVINLTQCLAAEWGPRGVRVNAVSPGFTQTPALEKGITTRTLSSDLLASNAAMGRVIEAAEIASAVAFLASTAASAITGVNLPVDAGYLVATPWAAYGGLRHC